jgi:hypothetical protein
MRGQWSVVQWSLKDRKWSVDKCSEVEWSVLGWSVVKCSDSLSNRVSNIIRRYIDHMKFAAFMAFLFIIFFHVLLVSLFITIDNAYMSYMLLFNFVNFVFSLFFMYSSCYVYIFLFLYMFCSVYSVFIVLFYVLFVCKCVLYCCHRVSTQLHLTNISITEGIAEVSLNVNETTKCFYTRTCCFVRNTEKSTCLRI